MVDIRGSAELDRAIQILTPREHSVLELRRKLMKRNIEPEKIDAIVTYLLELDYLSDERFAEAYVKQRINKGDGPLKIYANLQQRGIDEHLIESALSIDEEDWVAYARNVVLKRYGEEGEETTPLLFNEWSRRGKFLTNRGFPAHLVRQVLGDYQSD